MMTQAWFALVVALLGLAGAVIKIAFDQRTSDSRAAQEIRVWQGRVETDQKNSEEARRAANSAQTAALQNQLTDLISKHGALMVTNQTLMLEIVAKSETISHRDMTIESQGVSIQGLTERLGVVESMLPDLQKSNAVKDKQIEMLENSLRISHGKKEELTIQISVLQMAIAEYEAASATTKLTFGYKSSQIESDKARAVSDISRTASDEAREASDQARALSDEQHVLFRQEEIDREGGGV